MTVQLFSKLFGYSPEAVKAQTTISRQKIVTLGTLLIIPVFLWGFSAFYISKYLIGSSTLVAIVTGIVLGSFILIVDRSFIATPKVKGKKLLTAFRFIFALVATILGSLALDLIVFQGDLQEFRDAKMEKEKSLEADTYFETHDSHIERLDHERSEAKALADKSMDEFIHDVSGTGGSGKYGYGVAARQKEKRAQADQSKFEMLDAEYQLQYDLLKAEALKHGETQAKKRSDALLSQIEDLHEFAFSGWVSGTFYIIFLIFVFALESFFIIYKSFVSESLFEQLLESEESTGLRRLKSITDYREEILRQDRLLGPTAESVRKRSRHGVH